MHTELIQRGGPGGIRRTNRRFAAGRWLLVALVMVATSMIVTTVGGDASVSAARTWHVAPWGDDAAAGLATSPYRTIRRAVRRAGDGDTIVLRGGVYRESVQVYGKQVHLRSLGGERAVLDGSQTLSGWTALDGAWFSGGWTQQYSRERSGGPVSGERIVAGYPDQVFIDDEPLRQVLSLDEVEPGTFFHETEADRIWVGDDPRGREVRASGLQWALYFNRAHGSSLTNVTVRRYATEARNMAAIRAYADDIVLQGVVVEKNARMGLSVIGRNINVRDSRFVDNGYLGVHGDGLTGFVLERSAVVGNNQSNFDDFHSAGGIKLTNSRRVTIRDNDVSFNQGPGIWTDLDTNYVTLLRNLVEGNRRAGIEIELSSSVQVLSNVLIDNGEAGVWVLESKNVEILHNSSLRNQNAIEIEEGPRRQVVHVRVFNNILGQAAEGSRALLDVNDWTQERSPNQMGVTADYNAYWIAPGSGTENLSSWGRSPEGAGTSPDLDAHREATGLDANSVMSREIDNPFVRSESDFDYRGPDSLRRGAEVDGAAADSLGIESGARIRIGPTGPVERR